MAGFPTAYYAAFDDLVKECGFSRSSRHTSALPTNLTVIPLKPLALFAESSAYRLCDAFFLLAQELGGEGAGGEAEPISPLQRILGSPFVLGGGLLALFYIMVLLPEKRKKQQAAKQLSLLKKNTRIVTVGGIHGVIVSAPADSDVVTIKTDESSNSRLRINRSAIATVLDDEKSDAKKESDS